jgi:DNA-directed RNA polymerase specialized sigma subunit
MKNFFGKTLKNEHVEDIVHKNYSSLDSMFYQNNYFFDLDEEQNKKEEELNKQIQLHSLLITVSLLTTHTKMIIWYTYLHTDDTQRELSKKLGIPYNRLRVILREVNNKVCEHYNISKKTLKQVFNKC